MRISGIRFAVNLEKQGRSKDELRLQIDLIEGNKMRRVFLSGILCGVIMAAAVTFTLAIPANNIHWRVEIVKRGGGTWYFDKNGHLGWRWIVPLISDGGRPASLIIVPRPRRNPDSSRATRL
jgi:hypothetical protein